MFFIVWKYFSLWKMPFPPITRFVKICKDVSKIIMRANDDFKKKVLKIEEDIASYEHSVNMSSSVEAATEASPQFFLQMVYFLPNLIINLLGSQNWKELVSFKMISIAFSFTSVAISNYFIR